MGTDVIKTLSDGIDMVAKKLGVAVDKIYPVLIKQAQYDYTMDMIWIAISLIVITISVITIRYFFKIYKKHEIISGDDYDTRRDKRDKREISTIGIVIPCIIVVICLLISFACLNEMVQIRVNPEWYIFNNYIKTLIK